MKNKILQGIGAITLLVVISSTGRDIVSSFDTEESDYKVTMWTDDYIVRLKIDPEPTTQFGEEQAVNTAPTVTK